MHLRHEQLQRTLKSSGNSSTVARQLVFETLEQNHPITMAELVKLCQNTADRASVYRTVALFEQLKIITRVNLGWKYQLELSDRFSHHHHHLTCVSCGKVVKITESPEIERAIIQLTSRAGFTPDSHQLEIKGLCKSCQT